jgi:hypothetical protein
MAHNSCNGRQAVMSKIVQKNILKRENKIVVEKYFEIRKKYFQKLF